MISDDLERRRRWNSFFFLFNSIVIIIMLVFFIQLPECRSCTMYNPKTGESITGNCTFMRMLQNPLESVLNDFNINSNNECPPPIVKMVELDCPDMDLKCPDCPVCPEQNKCPSCSLETMGSTSSVSTTTIEIECGFTNTRELLNNRPGGGKSPCYQAGWFDCKKEYLDLLGLKSSKFNEAPSSNWYVSIVGDTFTDDKFCFNDEGGYFLLDTTYYWIKDNGSLKKIYNHYETELVE